jgi:hypothetical protein
MTAVMNQSLRAMMMKMILLMKEISLNMHHDTVPHAVNSLKAPGILTVRVRKGQKKDQKKLVHHLGCLVLLPVVVIMKPQCVMVDSMLYNSTPSC